MKRTTNSLLFMLGMLTLPLCSLAQEKSSICSAAFVGKNMVVDQYTTSGKCVLPASAKGDLTVQTVALTPTRTEALEKVDFKVAIREQTTGKLRSYSGKTFRQVPVQAVLATCKKGDRIVLQPIGKQYSLPHNEIQVR